LAGEARPSGRRRGHAPLEAASRTQADLVATRGADGLRAVGTDGDGWNG
jgi:hypothetical protein